MWGERMSQFDKLLIQILSGAHDKNIRFSDLKNVLLGLGFSLRVRGDHFIYTMTGIEEILNIQPDGVKAKPYQVRQVRNLIVKHGLGGKFDA